MMVRMTIDLWYDVILDPPVSAICALNPLQVINLLNMD